MRRFVVALSLLCLLTPCAFGKNTVKLADVARLSPQQQSSLKDAEFELSQSRIAWAGARERSREARAVFDEARHRIRPAELSVKAARLEQKAARANRGTERMAAAAATLAGAENERDAVALLVRWREKEFKAAQLAVAEAQARIDLGQARLDLARVRALIAERLPVAEKYSVAEFEKRSAAMQKDYEQAQSKTRRMTAAASELRIAWTQRAGTIGQGYAGDSASRSIMKP